MTSVNRSNTFDVTEITKNESKNRKYKDSLFCKIFSDKEAMFELYQYLHSDDKESTIDDLRKIVLDNSLVNEYYNDVAFTVKDKADLKF